MRTISCALVVGLALAVEPAWLPSASADEPPLLCEDTSVAGVYGLNAEDFVPPSASRETAGVGVLELRTDGTATLTFDGFEARRANRAVTEVYEGSWSVDANCIGSVALDGREAEHAWRFVAVDSASELLFVDGGTATATTGKLLSTKSTADDPPRVVARDALTAFTQAVGAGPEALDAVLAPEFQIQRANGVGFDREGYIASDLPAIDESVEQRFEDLVVTMSGDVMVVRYFFEISETIDGEPVDPRGPRLTVFRHEGGRWLVVSHANFAAE